MPKFILIHTPGKELTMEIAEPFAKAIKAHHTTDAYWVRSWYVREEGRLYCEWDAKNPESMREVIAKIAPDFANDEIYELEYTVNSEDFRE